MTAAGVPAALDPDSRVWFEGLCAVGRQREETLARLRDLLVRVTSSELRRRSSAVSFAGPELRDIAEQAANDAMLAILVKLRTFRGESRFTTWAYRFAVLEVSNKLGRHYWRNPEARFDPDDWGRLPDRLGVDPADEVGRTDLVAAVRRAVTECLTDHQRRVFEAVVLSGAPSDAVGIKLGLTRGAMYKTVYDARRKIRAFLVANGYLEDGRPDGPGSGTVVPGR